MDRLRRNNVSSIGVEDDSMITDFTGIKAVGIGADF
jgi:hypothetical protein